MRLIALAAVLACALSASAVPAATPQAQRPTGEQWGPRREFPRGPLGTARIKLERTACFGTCPIYTVEIHGDGTVIWRGERFVKAVGLRRYRIPVTKVRPLVEKFRAARFYSARNEYVDNGITDMPSATMTLTYGGVTKSVRDYAGPRVGMPASIKALEAAIDEAAGTKALIGPPQRGRR